MLDNEDTRAANDNIADLFDDPNQIDDIDDTPASPPRATTPEERAEAQARANAKHAAEQAGVAAERARIAMRQAIGEGWDGAANDNESFPLLKALRSEKRDDAIAIVMRYRALAAVVAAQPLQGASATADDGLAVAHRSTRLAGPEAVDAAAAAGWPGDALDDDEINYKETIRVRKGAAGSTGKRARIASDDDPTPSTASLSRRFNVDLLDAQIDARPILGELRAALGPLLDYFEDAVLGGRTLAEIGARAGGGSQTSAAVGKAFVLQAIDVVRDAWRLIEIREAKRAADADRAALRRRAKLAERTRAYLMRVA